MLLAASATEAASFPFRLIALRSRHCRMCGPATGWSSSHASSSAREETARSRSARARGSMASHVEASKDEGTNGAAAPRPGAWMVFDVMRGL